jgi:hypothetical protein
MEYLSETDYLLPFLLIALVFFVFLSLRIRTLKRKGIVLTRPQSLEDVNEFVNVFLNVSLPFIVLFMMLLAVLLSILLLW